MNFYHRHTRKEMTPFLPPSYTRVLEVGCGTGGFRAHLDQANEYWGVEIAEPAAALAACRLDRVLQGDFLAKAPEIPDGYFDLIVCNDVMEHMPDHDRFLDTLKAKLSPGGHLILSVPNMRHLACLFELLVRKDWRYREEGVLDRTHLRFFTRKSLARTLRDHGLLIERIEGVNSILSGQPLLRKAAIRLAAWVFGKDVLFLQFGVRSTLPA